MAMPACFDSNNNKNKMGRASLVLSFLILSVGTAALDTDVDGISDALDNCQLVSNVTQRDTDADGYGNDCDADFDNNLIANFLDFSFMSSVFFSSEPHDVEGAQHADLNGDGTVNFFDLFIFQNLFLQAPGPSAIDNPFDHNAAARFLTQTTFGPTASEISDLAASGDLNAWLDNQFLIPTTEHEPLTRQLALHMCLDTPDNLLPDGFYIEARQAAWWTHVLNGPDQLRQRVAFALSQVLVVGDGSDVLANSQYAMSSYYDMLADNAFGNFRDLLEDVTLHPVMAIFLSMARNEPPNPALNIRPDENYARELLQLFSIGVHELNPDGSKVLDGNGVPIATYTQSDIEQFARVFTGWNYDGISWFQWSGLADLTLPMVPVETYHDTDAKTLLGGEVLPAGQNAATDLSDALDNVFNQPNVGPFISRLLIQRLVTSNPTPGYIQRVASVFDNDGSGIRGDMKAVLRAIFLDQEALQGHVIYPTSFGKLREPLLRVSQLRRAFGAQAVVQSGDRWNQNPCGQPSYAFYPSPFGSSSQTLGQQALSSPSVFNFFSPDYSPPGEVRESGLVAPEFSLFVASTAQSTGSVIAFEAQNNQLWGPGWVELSINNEIALATQPEQLLDHLDTLLVNGQMSTAMRADLLSHMNDPSLPTDGSLNEVRARDAILLILMSPEYLVQR